MTNLYIDTSAGGVTIKLPNPSHIHSEQLKIWQISTREIIYNNKQFIIKKIDSSSNCVIIEGLHNVDKYILPAQYDHCFPLTIDNKWYIL